MLFNSALFNTALFDGSTTLATVYSTDTLVFNNFSLSDGTNMILNSLPLSGPSRDLIGGNVPRGDGEYLTAEYFRHNPIEASGYVQQSTAALLEAYLDTIRRNLRKREQNLDITDANGTVKRFVATVDNFDSMFADRQSFHVTYCPWKARFVCKTPFGQSRDYSSTFLSFSTSPTTQSIVNSGTAVAQPVLVLNFLTASSVSAITVTNSTTGESITYTASIAAGDIVVFDSEMKTVTKNGTAVDFSGAFLSLDTGANLISITVTGTSFSLEATYKFKTRYL